MNNLLVLDNTKRATFMQCKKKYYLQHVKGQQPVYGSTAIRYGVVWHAVQEGYCRWVLENGWPVETEDVMAAITAGLELGKKKWDKETGAKIYHDDYRNFNAVVEAFSAYLDAFNSDRVYLKIISTEKKFECPIEAENELEKRLLAKLPSIVFTGRIDLCVEMDQVKWMWDFKTTGWILDQAISKINRSPQLIGYAYAGGRVLDFIPMGCLCSFAHVSAYKSKTTGDWGKVKYEFRRIPQVFSDQDIQAWKLSFIDTCREIVYASEHDLWPESFDNCYQYGPCAYLRLCRQHKSYEELNLDGFYEEFWNVLDED